MTLPTHVPMIPTLVSKPFHRAGWVDEEKVDGWRIWPTRTRTASASV
jgi:hypothetical protein